MSLFTYKAVNSKGTLVEDTIQAASREEAARELKSGGMQVLLIKKLETRIGSLISGKISTTEKATLCRFLSTMLRAGLSLPEAVEILRQETTNKRTRKILSDISFQTMKGESLSTVLGNYKSDFDPVFLTMIKAGEESGTLDQSFDYLAKQLVASHDLSQKIISALMYPIVIIIAMLANGLVMMIFVLPMISGVFSKMNIKLPLYTKILMSFGNFVGKNTLLVLVVFTIVILLSVTILLLGSTRRVILKLIGYIPPVRRLLNQIDVVRFSRTLSTLLKRGVPIITSLDVAADSLGQESLKKQAKQFSVGVEKGETLSSILVKNRGSFPLIMIQTIKAGEKTGSLDQVLQELAEFYEREVDYNLKRLTALLEPVLMLVIGVAVGVMVILVIAPIYSIIGGLQTSITR